MADLGAFFKKTLPGMAAAVASGIPGPIGAVAQIVSAAIGKELKPDGSAIEAAVAGATPEQILKLKEDDQNFQVTMQKLGFEHVEELEKIAADDRASARNREATVRDLTTRILGFTVVGAFVGVLMYVLSGRARVDTVLAGTMIGYISAKAELVMTYYFGSSAGSARKTELMGMQPGSAKSM